MEGTRASRGGAVYAAKARCRPLDGEHGVIPCPCQGKPYPVGFPGRRKFNFDRLAFRAIRVRTAQQRGGDHPGRPWRVILARAIECLSLAIRAREGADPLKGPFFPFAVEAVVGILARTVDAFDPSNVEANLKASPKSVIPADDGENAH